MSNRTHAQDEHARPTPDAGTRARRRLGVAARRRVARHVVERGQRARSWVRAVVLCKAALLAAILMFE